MLHCTDACLKGKLQNVQVKAGHVLLQVEGLQISWIWGREWLVIPERRAGDICHERARGSHSHELRLSVAGQQPGRRDVTTGAPSSLSGAGLRMVTHNSTIVVTVREQ